MRGSLDLDINGLEHSNFRVPPAISMTSPEQHTRPDIVYLPHPLDNPTARQRILDNGAAPEAVAKVFDEQGRWILRGQRGDYPTFWQSQPTLIGQAMVHELKPVYDLVDYNLRGEKWPHGYNRHDLEHHVFEVLDASEYLLDRSGFRNVPDVARANKVATLGHDVMNAEDRDAHAAGAPIVVSTIIPDVEKSPKEWEMASEAMRLHDEKALLSYLGSFGNLSPEEKISLLRKLNNPVLLALVIADKLASIGRQRTNPWARAADTVNGDVHMWTNYLARGRGLEFSRDGKELKAVVEFNPNITDDEYQDFLNVAVKRSHHDGFRAMVPEVIQQIHRDHQVPQFLAWAGNLVGIYLHRFEISALCAKAQNPRLEKFLLELHDQRGIRSRGGGRLVEEVHFDGNLAEQFDALEMVYKSPKDRRPEDYEQAEIVFEGPQ